MLSSIHTNESSILFTILHVIKIVLSHWVRSALEKSFPSDFMWMVTSDLWMVSHEAHGY